MNRLQFDESFSLFSLAEIMETTDSNRKIKKLLETFECTKNQDLQEFLHNKALTFEKHLRSRTYLYIDNVSKNIVAYFTIAVNTLHTANISKEVIQLLDGYRDDIVTIPCFLIGQLGKSSEYESLKIGEFVLNDAISIIDESQKSLGGRFILLDAINNKKSSLFMKKMLFLPLKMMRKMRVLR